METVLSGFAQFDKEVRTYRTSEGMKRRLEQGGWPHDAPIGYIKSRTKSGITTIEPDPGTAPKMKMFFESFSSGQYNVRQAADLAYEIGITSKSGKRRTWQTTMNTLRNPIYAGYIQSKYTDGKRLTGVHEAIISTDTFEKNQRILDGKAKTQTRMDESDYPLRRDFLKCAYCDKFVTGSAPRGNGGRYPRYSCMSCKSSQLGGKKVSKSSEEIHNEFRHLLSQIRYRDGRTKMFKHVVLSRWVDEYDDALKNAHEINKEVKLLQEERARTIRKYTSDKITYDEKEIVVKDIDKELAALDNKKIEADIYTQQREKIVDMVMMFIDDPAEFWNRAPIQIQKRVQRTIFPEGLSYDFEKGFGTVRVNESYQLIKKMTPDGVKNPIVVAASGLEPLTSGL